MTTRAEAIEAAARALALGYVTALGLDGTSVEDAAKAAYTPTGPDIEELKRRIAAMRKRFEGVVAA
jgi:hypothetical protein